MYRRVSIFLAAHRGVFETSSTAEHVRLIGSVPAEAPAAPVPPPILANRERPAPPVSYQAQVQPKPTVPPMPRLSELTIEEADALIRLQGISKTAKRNKLRKLQKKRSMVMSGLNAGVACEQDPALAPPSAPVPLSAGAGYAPPGFDAQQAAAPTPLVPGTRFPAAPPPPPDHFTPKWMRERQALMAEIKAKGEAWRPGS